MASFKLVCLVLACMVLAAPLTTHAAVTCGQVTSAVAPCIGYLRGTGAAPTAGCCTGVRNLAASAKTTPDRQQACRCLKTAASAVSGINPKIAEGLPGACRVSIPYKISTSTNCDTVK